MKLSNTIRYVDPKTLKLHPLFNLVPHMRTSEWNDFYTDIAMRNIRVPLEVLADGTILDGRHRWEAALKLNMPEVPIIDAPLNGDGPDIYMLKAAVLRRHLSDDQRAVIAAMWKKENKREPYFKQESQAGPGRGNTINDKQLPTRNGNSLSDQHKTINEATQLFNVHRGKIDKATYVQTRNPELLTKVHTGEIALNNAFRQVKGKEEKQKIANTVPPTGKYQVIVVDPPWPFNSRQNDPTHQMSNPYENMSMEDIKNLNIPAHEDSILWLWVPNAFLHEAFHVLESWGFTYRTTLTWAKNFVGLGDWLGGRTEHCLMATKGNYKVFRNNESTLLNAPRSGHSEKPEEFYEIVRKLCPGTKIDMFNRRNIDGFVGWGAESNGRTV